MKKYRSRMLLFAFIVSLIPLTVFGAGADATPNLNSPDPETKRAYEVFGEQSVKRFEKMFETGQIDYYYTTEKYKCNVIHYAAFRGNLDRVKKMLSRYEDAKYLVNAEDYNRRTPLHYAIEEGNIHVLEYLVEHGANPNQEDRHNMSILHDAALRGNLELVQWLVGHGANLYQEDTYKRNALHYAAAGGNLRLVKWLVDEKKFDVNAKKQGICETSVLQYAALSGNYELVKWLVDEKKMDVHMESTFKLFKSEKSVLHFAAESGNLHLVRWLINEKGLKKDERLLFYAARSNNVKLVEWLVATGIDINAKNTVLYGEDYAGGSASPLYEAARNGNLEMVKWLVQHGADINVVDSYGHTILHVAAESGNLDLVKWLAGQGMDVTVKTEKGYSVVDSAAESGNLEMVEWLVDQGCTVNETTLRSADRSSGQGWYRSMLTDRKFKPDLQPLFYFLRKHGVKVSAVYL